MRDPNASRRRFTRQLELAIVDAAARLDLVMFLMRIFEIVAPGEILHLNWHILAMAHALERVRSGEIKRLIITLPP